MAFKSPTTKTPEADHAAVPDAQGGYSTSGSSQWTRTRAHGFDADVKAKKKAPRRKLSARGLLYMHEQRLADLRKVLPGSTGDRRHKILADIEIKMNFCAKLRKEIAAS